MEGDKFCIICYGEEGMIERHEGHCGVLMVHEECIREWDRRNRGECIICRKKMIDEDYISECEEDAMELMRELRYELRINKYMRVLLSVVGVLILNMILNIIEELKNIEDIYTSL